MIELEKNVLFLFTASKRDFTLARRKRWIPSLCFDGNIDIGVNPASFE